MATTTTTTSFNFHELAQHLGATLEANNASGFYTLKVSTDGLDLEILAKDDSHYHVSEGKVQFQISSRFEDKWGRTYYMDESMKINVSSKKTPAAVASEIQRRLLTPEALKQVREHLENIRVMEERVGSKIQKMEKVASLIDSSEEGIIGPNTDVVYTSSHFPVQFKTSHWLEGKVKIDGMVLTPQQLEAVCEALKNLG